MLEDCGFDWQLRQNMRRSRTNNVSAMGCKWSAKLLKACTCLLRCVTHMRLLGSAHARTVIYMPSQPSSAAPELLQVLHITRFPPDASLNKCMPILLS